MTMADTKLDLSPLSEDGDTLELGDGRTLRLKIEVDQFTDINDFDCYGRVSTERERTNEYGWKVRPSDMTGNAEKLWFGNYGPWWWEPPADVKRTDPAFPALRDQVRELLAFGFKGVILEVLQGEDAYHRPIVTATASLWGVDTTEPEYVRYILHDLAFELGLGE